MLKNLGFALLLALGGLTPAWAQEFAGPTTAPSFTEQVGIHEGTTAARPRTLLSEGKRGGFPTLRPDEYEVLLMQGRVARIAPDSLPFRVYVGDPVYQPLLDAAIKTWNSGGMGTLFVSSCAEEADLRLDWTGSAVPEGARAETRLEVHGAQIVPASLSIRPGRRSQDSLARSLAHELGHVLGLGHSSNDDDLMHGSERRSGRPALSDRDRQALEWLYSQPEYFAVRGQGPGRTVGDASTPQAFGISSQP